MLAVHYLFKTLRKLMSVYSCLKIHRFRYLRINR